MDTVAPHFIDRNGHFAKLHESRARKSRLALLELEARTVDKAYLDTVAPRGSAFPSRYRESENALGPLMNSANAGRRNDPRGAGNSRLSAKARNAQHEAVKDGTSLFGGRGIGRVGLGTDLARACSKIPSVRAMLLGKSIPSGR